MKRILVIPIAFLAGCTVKPTIRSGDTVVTLGGSIFTKTTNETASYTGPLGTLNYSTASNDETVVPNKGITAWTTAEITRALSNAYDTSEATKVTLGEQEVSKTATAPIVVPPATP